MPLPTPVKYTAEPPPSSSSPSALQYAVICEGWVLKKRRKKMQGFARRYFILQDSGHLSYSFGPGKPPRDEVHLPRAAISTAPGRKDIHIDSDAATFHIKCHSMEDFDKWMSAFRRFIVTDAQRKSTIKSPRLATWSFVKLGTAVDEMGLTISELEASLSTMHTEMSQIKRKGSKAKLDKDIHKEHTKEGAAIFALFKKSASHATTEDSRSDASSSLSRSDSSERVFAALNSLKSQHAALLKSLKILSLSESYQSSAPSSGLPFTAEEEDCLTPVEFSPTFRLGNRSSVSTSFTDTVNEWYDAHDGLDGAEEFVLDSQPSPAEAEHVNNIEVLDSHSTSSLELQESSADTDAEEEEVSATLLSQVLSEEAGRLVRRRSRLAAGPVADEGSLFAILKKNVGKDLSAISFPVTFNEPLTLLQRTAEEVEYCDLLRQAATASDPVERLCYVAAFAVSGYAHTRFRTGRKGFTPMLAETFEDVRMKFIAEKVRHQPLAMAFHAEGEGWELYGTSAGKTKFWGKSLEIIPLGTTHLKIGDDHFAWKKPSSFVRNLMMGTKYLEHCGKLTIENTTTHALCVLDFKQSGMWTVSNSVSGHISLSDGQVVAELEGNWDDHLSQLVDSSNLRIFWKASAFPKNARDFYGFTSFGITLNDIAIDLEGVLPPTDSRYRPDVRALEEGHLDIAEAEKARIEEMQRARRRQNTDREPRWFKQEGDEWIYIGGYWEGRKRGWKDMNIDTLW